MGTGRLGNTVYVTDFGLAADCERDLDVERHACHQDLLRSRDTIALAGTARFASLNGHLGGGDCNSISQLNGSNIQVGMSRGDDLESLGYLLFYLIHGSLPWQGLEAADEWSKEKPIMSLKEAFEPSQFGAEIPREFTIFFDHVRSLGLNDRPRYSYLRGIFRNLFVRRGFEYDHVYDWSIIMYAIANPSNQNKACPIPEPTRNGQTARDRKEIARDRRRRK